MFSLIIAAIAVVLFVRAAWARPKAGWRRLLAALGAALAATLGPGLAFGLLRSQLVEPALFARAVLPDHYAAFDLGWRILTIVTELVLSFALYRRFFASPAAAPLRRR